MRTPYKFELYKDFFIKDLNNTMYFKSVDERNDYFDSIPSSEKIEFTKDFNHVTDLQSINVPSMQDYKEISKCTYGCFTSTVSENRYFFNIITTNYNNDYTTQVNFLIDPFVTYNSGGYRMQTIYNTQSIRRHLSKSDYEKNIKYITHNNDVLYTGTNIYSVQQKLHKFSKTGNYVLIQSSVDLSGGFTSFGNTDSPIMPSSNGTKFDEISSQVSLYLMEEHVFLVFTKDLRTYSWIAQNIIKAILIPQDFIKIDSLVKLESYTDYNIYQMPNGGRSENILLSDISFSFQEICNFFKIDYEKEKHLLRYPYCYIELNAWNGKKIDIHIENISPDAGGLSIRMMLCLGFHNQIAIFQDKYNSLNENDENDMYKGDFLNNALIIDTFDDIPVLVNNYNLGLAKSAYQRDLAETKLISSRAMNIVTGSNDEGIAGRLFDIVSIATNFSPTALGEKITDEYEFYRKQNAEFNDAKLTTPSLSAQTHSNNFQIKNSFFGVTMKFKQVAPEIIENVRQYHKNFGYEIPFFTDYITLGSMTKCDYVKCKLNNYKMFGVDNKISEIFRLRLENGVKFWNYPFTSQSLKDNEVK